MTDFLIQVTDSDDDVAELRDLYSALLDDDELRTAKKSIVAGRPSGEQMGFEDVLRLVLENPGLDTAVSSCVVAWLTARKSRRLKIVLRANGTAEIEADGVGKVTAGDVMKALAEARRDPDAEASGR